MPMTEPKPITYTSNNGFTGTLYGFSSLSIVDEDGIERMHTGFRSINTFDELKKTVDEYPKTLKMLDEIFPKIANADRFEPRIDKETNTWYVYDLEFDHYIRLPKEIEDEIKNMLGPKFSQLEKNILYREINKNADWLTDEHFIIYDNI